MTMATFTLVPRDGIFLKDGRGWYTSDVGHSHAHAWPLPPTIRGALRNAYGHAHMAQTGQTLSPAEWDQKTANLKIAKLVAFRGALDHKPGPAARLWPCPADAAYDTEGNVRRLAPEAPRLSGLADAQDPARAQLWRPYPAQDGKHGKHGKPGKAPLFWPDAVMMRWLRGDSIDTAKGHNPPRRTDMHVTITAETQAATQSMLFLSEVTEALDRTHMQWGIGVACTLPAAEASFPAAAVTLGGRRRLAGVEPAAEDLFAWPGELGGESRGLRLILATPALFMRGWLPDGFTVRGTQYHGRLPGLADEVILRAALVPPPLDLSTWDMKERAPRPTMRLVRPGAVYFFAKVNQAPFTNQELQALWLAQLGGNTDDGLGLVLPGRWQHT